MHWNFRRVTHWKDFYLTHLDLERWHDTKVLWEYSVREQVKQHITILGPYFFFYGNPAYSTWWCLPVVAVKDRTKWWHNNISTMRCNQLGRLCKGFSKKCRSSSCMSNNTAKYRLGVSWSVLGALAHLHEACSSVLWLTGGPILWLCEFVCQRVPPDATTCDFLWSNLRVCLYKNATTLCPAFFSSDLTLLPLYWHIHKLYSLTVRGKEVWLDNM